MIISRQEYIWANCAVQADNESTQAAIRLLEKSAK
jgi:hypothetical protein